MSEPTDEELEELANTRYTRVLTATPGGEAWATMCLRCGCLVGNETLHDDRCYGEVVNDRLDALARAEWERRVESGEFDDDDERTH